VPESVRVLAFVSMVPASVIRPPIVVIETLPATVTGPSTDSPPAESTSVTAAAVDRDGPHGLDGVGGI